MLAISDQLKSNNDIWSSFKAKRSNAELYVENAVVMYVPTSVGARGNAQIRRFFLNPQFAEKNVAVQEHLVSQLASEDRLIEEAVWTVHFHTSECNWLVPKVEDRLLRNATIKFPMTTFVSFENDKIASVRYSWDQAGVLKQLKVISDKLNWPVTTAEKQTESLIALDKVQLKDLNGEDNMSNQNSNIPLTATTGRNIFTYQPPPERRLVAPTNKLNSSFTFAHNDGSPVAGKPTPRVVHSIIR